jgi:hypothetical protein
MLAPAWLFWRVREAREPRETAATQVGDMLATRSQQPPVVSKFKCSAGTESATSARYADFATINHMPHATR